MISYLNCQKYVKNCFIGIQYFGGGTSVREPFRWNHICVSVHYTDSQAHRLIIVDGKLNFNFTTSFVPESKWPLGHNFTFGGREFEYGGYDIDGYITDVQIFSRTLPKEDMIAYTKCQKVKTIECTI